MIPSFYISCIILKISEIQDLKTGLVEFILKVQYYIIFCIVVQSGKVF